MIVTCNNCPNPECSSANIEPGLALNTSYEHEEFIFCTDCRLKGPRAKTREEAVRLWNLIWRAPWLSRGT